MSRRPNRSIVDAVATILGVEPSGWTPVTERGYANNERWIARLSDGSSAFAKLAVDARTAAWLRTEYLVYSALNERFLPKMVGWRDEGDMPVLVLENLEDCLWPPPWSSSSVDAVLGALRQISATRPPAGLPSLDSYRRDLASWARVAAEPEPFLELGLCSASWLQAALPALRDAEDAAKLEGEALVHLDVRSDNICIRGESAVLVDWNFACSGNPLMNIASWLPSLAAEGGPAPEEVLPEGADELAALVSGYFAARAGLPPPATAPRVRVVQRQQLEVALPWAARALGLSVPTPGA